MTADASAVQDIFSHATGTTRYHELSLIPGVLCTDSIAHLAEAAGAFWLVDIIASYNTVKYRQKYPFQFWKLEVTNGAGVVTMQEDTGRPVITQQEILYTDFPDGNWQFYCIKASPCCHVLMCPGDY